MTKDKTDPRGGKDELNTPKSDADTITPPSRPRPFNPSDEIKYQIEASDAKTKQPGNEFEGLSEEQVKDYATKLGIDGNDGLSRDEIIGKIRAFQGKRMFDDPKDDDTTPTSAELAVKARTEGKEAAQEEINKDLHKSSK